MQSEEQGGDTGLGLAHIESGLRAGGDRGPGGGGPPHGSGTAHLAQTWQSTADAEALLVVIPASAP